MPTNQRTSRRGPRKPSPDLWKRGNVYYARFSHNGRQIRKKLCSDLQVAEEMLAELKLATYRGEVGIVTTDYLVAALLDDYLRSVSQSIASSSAERYGQRARNLKRLLPAIKVSALDTEHVEVYRAERLDEGISAATINPEVEYLLAALTWGVQRKRIATNPVAKIRPLKHDKKESRPLTVPEVRQLLEASRPVWRDVYYAYLTTGLRKMELARLVWSDIDWQSRELIVRSTGAKNSKPRRIPLDAGLLRILTALHATRGHREHVFATPQGTQVTRNVYRQLLEDCRKAGIQTATTDVDGTLVEVVTVHSLRHTFCTHLIMAGEPPKTVQELMGHATLDMTMRVYSKVFPENKRAAIDHLPYGEGPAETPDVLRLQR
jgi:integrase